MKLTTLTASLVLAASTALADGPQPPYMEPPLTSPRPVERPCVKTLIPGTVNAYQGSCFEERINDDERTPYIPAKDRPTRPSNPDRPDDGGDSHEGKPDKPGKPGNPGKGPNGDKPSRDNQNASANNGKGGNYGKTGHTDNGKGKGRSKGKGWKN